LKITVEKSPLHSPTFKKAKRRRKLATSPDFDNRLMTAFVWVQYCGMSRRMLCAVWVSFALCLAVRAQERSITKEYRNYAEGFAVRIPTGMRGLAGDQAGPERGVTVSLPSGASVAIFGEPNSLEYKTAPEGIKESLSGQCQDGKPTVSAARVGKVRGAKGKLACGDRVIVEMLAFRPGGGPYLLAEIGNDPRSGYSR
jgi:hypothetical protein